MILLPNLSAWSSSSILGGHYKGKTQIETGVNLKVETKSQRERERIEWERACLSLVENVFEVWQFDAQCA